MTPSAPIPASARAPSIARNTFLNLVGQATPLVVGVVTIPIIARGLGDLRFGLLGLVWAIFGYLTVFDFGLTRATTKFVADCLARGRRDELPDLVAMAVTSQVLLGLAGGALLAGAAPLLVRAFDVPPALVPEARGAFLLLALSLPFVLLSLGLRAVLQAAQRFDLVNWIRAPSSSATFLLPAAGAAAGWGLPAIVGLLLAARVVTCLATALAVHSAVTALRWRVRWDWATLRSLLTFGGWVAVSNLLSPLLVYFERFALGALVGLSAVAYYTAPYETVTRLWILPAGLTAALFPAFASLSTRGERQASAELFGRSVRYLLPAVALPTFLIAVLASDLLRVWLGETYAREGAAALRILALGVFVNSVAHLPFSYLQGVGRPDVTAKLHLAETPPYLVVAWLLVSRFGITGAAVAWVLRVSVDGALLFGAVWRVSGVSPGAVAARVGRRAWTLLGLLGAAGAAWLMFPPSQPLWRVGVAGGLGLAFAAAVWRIVLGADERARLLAQFRRDRGVAAAGEGARRGGAVAHDEEA